MKTKSIVGINPCNFVEFRNDSLCLVEQLSEGDIICEIQYYKVGVVSRSAVGVTNDRGEKFTIANRILTEGAVSASQYSKTEKVRMTALAEILENAGDVVFTVNFQKKVKDVDVMATVESFNPGVMMSVADMKKAMRKTLKGEQRTAVGYLTGGSITLGRTRMVDMNKENDPSKDYDTRVILVDHRSINWIVIKGVKYTLTK